MNINTLLYTLLNQGIRLSLAGDRLKVQAAPGTLTEEIKMQLQARKDEIIALLSVQSAALEAEKEKLPQIVHDAEHRFSPFPLTDIQQAYWLGRQGIFDLGNVGTYGYNEIEGEIDIPRFQLAWQKMLDRHDMLRMLVLPTGEQKILPQATYQIPVIDMREASEAAVTDLIKQIREELSHKVINPEQWPLFEIRIIQCKNNISYLFIGIDLLITDFSGIMRLSHELAMLYDNPALALPRLEITFRDFVMADEVLAQTDLYKRSKDYWLKRIPTLPPAPELPMLKKLNELKESYRFKRRLTTLDPATWSSLKARAAQFDITPSALMLSIFAEVIGLWNATSAFTLNLTQYHRLPLHPQVNDIIGNSISMILLAIDQAKRGVFIENTRRIQQQLWDDLNHQYFNGVSVLRELRRQQGNNQQGALMPVVFTSVLGIDTYGIHTELFSRFGKLKYVITQTPQVWLDHQILEKGGALHISWDTIDELFPTGLIDTMFASYTQLLQDLIDSEAIWQKDYPVALPVLDKQIIKQVNFRKANMPQGLLHEMVWQQAQQNPTRTALITTERQINYGELYKIANQIGRFLRSKGVQPNQCVALIMDKGWEQIAGVLGILCAGAAYLPVDPHLPVERRNYQLQNAEVKLVLTQLGLQHALDLPADIEYFTLESPAILMQDTAPLAAVQQPGDLAYVLFTSGSTGQPKGVMLDHKGPLNTIMCMNQLINLQAADRVIALSALNFDLSVYDVFGTLAAGAALVIPDADKIKDPNHWRTLIQAYNISVWNTVPALMQMLVDYSDNHADATALNPLRQVLLSGDWVPVSLPEQIHKHCKNAALLSSGGPTETSIWCVAYPVEKIEAHWKSIPYGKPLPNMAIHLFDEHLQQRPLWATGEMYIEGVCVGKGYLNDAARTNAHFIPHPADPARILYKSGDLGRYLPDGNLEFIGRKDFQVKINGYRIELGEIEHCLQSYPAITKALVTTYGVNKYQQKLVAYFTAQDPAGIDIEQLKQFMQAKLPDYMVPAQFILLKEFPMNANNKIDRHALPKPEITQQGEIILETARNATEALLVKLVQEVTGIQYIGVKQNLFELGVDSINIVRINAKLKEVLHKDIPVVEMFHYPNIALLAEHLNQGDDLNLQKELADSRAAKQRAFLERKRHVAQAEKVTELQNI